MRLPNVATYAQQGAECHRAGVCLVAGFGKIVNASVADRVAKHRRTGRMIARREPENIRRRKRLEKDPQKWLVHYCGKQSYPYPFSDGHKAIISETIEAAKTGTGSAVAAPRGEGKTTVLRGVTVFLVATRVVRFPVLVGWKHRDAKAALRLWQRMLTESEEFRADYPELTQPFEHSTHATALKNLTWKDTETHCGAMVDTADQLITLPDSIGAVASRSAQGDAKGLNAILPDGTVLRPDFVIFDDAQDVSRSDNPTAVSDTVDVLENVFLGMAGPQKRLTAAAACTVEAENDVSEHWLARPGWRSLRVSRIEEWPEGGAGGDWPDPKCAAAKLWDEWNHVRVDRGEDGEVDAVQFYLDNKDAMTAGMRVSWVERYDRERGDPDAMYAAMWDRYNQGADVFARGQQNRPLKKGVTLYSLTSRVITSRNNGDPVGVVPDWAIKVVAATDINPSYALSTVVLAYGPDQLCAVLWYGLHKMSTPVRMEMTEAEKRKIIYEELATHAKTLAAMPCRPNLWVIDGGGSPANTVIDFAANAPQISGLETVCAFGRAANQYRPTGKNKVFPGEQHHRVFQAQHQQWMIFNADYWREIAQRAWTGSPGAPGACSLPVGKHDEFAQQICREPLLGKGEVGGFMRWEWGTLPGPHDYGDCMTMGFMGAAACGIGTAGVGLVQPKKKRKRSVRHVAV